MRTKLKFVLVLLTSGSSSTKSDQCSFRKPFACSILCIQSRSNSRLLRRWETLGRPHVSWQTFIGTYFNQFGAELREFFLVSASCLSKYHRHNVCPHERPSMPLHWTKPHSELRPTCVRVMLAVRAVSVVRVNIARRVLEDAHLQSTFSYKSSPFLGLAPPIKEYTLQEPHRILRYITT